MAELFYAQNWIRHAVYSTKLDFCGFCSTGEADDVTHMQLTAAVEANSGRARPRYNKSMNKENPIFTS